MVKKLPYSSVKVTVSDYSNVVCMLQANSKRCC
ncbi:hypothetical protein PPIS_a6004 [Pseudoalteromonas piscicida]|uniref:Uncharacterized protein n=1 Tax=Pseudoalteromonas piscicida TaxID=43662 RepID=A0ABM6NIL9_PSEO7|nr:hypothetical protein PPIS_a6004 [Pseudoalteromonas piscicida]